jgi:methyl-accepting chemotaxis protein
MTLAARTRLLAALSGLALLASAIVVGGVLRDVDRRVAAQEEASRQERAIGALREGVRDYRAAALAHAVTRRRGQEVAAAERLAELERALAALEPLRPATVEALRPVLADYARALSEVSELLSGTNRNRGIAVYLNQVLPLEARMDAPLAEALQAARDTAATAAREQTEARGWLIDILVGAGLILALVIGGLSIAFTRALARFGEIGGAMTLLADGRRETPIPGLARRDEIGAMARAVGVFRDAQAKADALALEAEDARRAGEEARRRGREELAGTVEAQLRAVVDGLGASAARLDAALGDLSRSVAGAASCGEAAAASARTTNENVGQAASETEALAGAVEQITRRMAEAGEISRRAVAGAETAGQTVDGLRAAVARIGDVVRLIGDIAGGGPRRSGSGRRSARVRISVWISSSCASIASSRGPSRRRR